MANSKLRFATVLTALALIALPALGVGDPIDPGGSLVDEDGNVHEGGIEAIAVEGITRGVTRRGITGSVPPTR